MVPADQPRVPLAHGDTFDLPIRRFVPVASSQFAAKQGFTSRDGRLIGLQFHLELRPEDVQTLCRHGVQELHSGQPIAGPKEQIARRLAHSTASR